LNNKTVGHGGEEAALQFIQSQGYAIIDTNVRPFLGMRRGEIDIIAWYGQVLCIIEVKTRASRRFDVTEAITVAKRRQLTRLAQAYMSRHNIASNECRFDVVCVYTRQDGKPPDIELSQGAFDPVY
jgi:putative endonuclease